MRCKTAKHFLMVGVRLGLLLLLSACRSAANGRDVVPTMVPELATGYSVAAPAEVPPQSDELELVPAPVERQEGPELWDEVSYVVQEGQAGQRSSATGAVLIEPVPTIIRVGTRSGEQVEREAERVAEQYLAAYQEGEWAQVAGLSRSAAPLVSPAANAAAAVQLLSYTVAVRALHPVPADALGYRAAVALPTPERNFDLEGGPIVEPFGVEALVQATIEMRVFAAPLTWEGDLRAIWQPEVGWRMQPWGVLAAGAGGEVFEGVTLRGVAVWPRETLVVVRQPPDVPVYLTVVEQQSEGAAGSLTEVEAMTSTGTAWLPRVDPELAAVTVRLAVGFGAGQHTHDVAVPQER